MTTEEEVEALKKRADALEADVSDLRRRLGVNTTILEAFKAQIEELARQIGSAAAWIPGLDQRLAKLERHLVSAGVIAAIAQVIVLKLLA